MHKDNLIKKYVMYIDKNSSFRMGRVVKVTGKTLTVKNAYKEKHRIHPDKNKILGVLKTKKIKGKKMFEYLEEIQWS